MSRFLWIAVEIMKQIKLKKRLFSTRNLLFCSWLRKVQLQRQLFSVTRYASAFNKKNLYNIPFVTFEFSICRLRHAGKLRMY